jgi:hypothetical protein
LKHSVGLGTETADLVRTAEGREGYLIQIAPEDDDLFNITDGQWPWGQEGEVIDLPEHATLVFDPDTLADGYFTFYCTDCGKNFVDRRVIDAVAPRCPRCEPE